MVESHPEVMQFVRHRGLDRVRSGCGLIAFLQGVEGCLRFSVVAREIAVAALGGSLPALLELRFARGPHPGHRPRGAQPQP